MPRESWRGWGPQPQPLLSPETFTGQGGKTLFYTCIFIFIYLLLIWPSHVLVVACGVFQLCGIQFLSEVFCDPCKSLSNISAWRQRKDRFFVFVFFFKSREARLQQAVLKIFESLEPQAMYFTYLIIFSLILYNFFCCFYLFQLKFCCFFNTTVKGYPPFIVTIKQWLCSSSYSLVQSFLEPLEPVLPSSQHAHAHTHTHPCCPPFFYSTGSVKSALSVIFEMKITGLFFCNFFLSQKFNFYKVFLPKKFFQQ